MRIDFLDGEITFPPTHVQETIVRHAAAHVLDFRQNGENVPRGHRRQVGYAKRWLSRAEILPGSDHGSMQIERSSRSDNEERNQDQQPEPIHNERYIPVKSLALKLKQREATFLCENCQLDEIGDTGLLQGGRRGGGS